MSDDRLNTHRDHLRSIRDAEEEGVGWGVGGGGWGVGGGGSGRCEQLVPMLRPAKASKTASSRTRDVKAMTEGAGQYKATCELRNLLFQQL